MLYAMVVTASLLAAEKTEGGVQFFDGSWESALEKSAKTKKPLLVDFMTDW